MATGLENLKIYQMAKALEMQIHQLTASFPREERYRSVDQLRRSSTSVTNNIAEAYYKNSVKEKSYILRNLVITEGEETRSNVLRCGEKGLIDPSTAQEISDGYTQLRKATHGYIRFLQRYLPKSRSSSNSSTH